MSKFYDDVYCGKVYLEVVILREKVEVFNKIN